MRPVHGGERERDCEEKPLVNDGEVGVELEKSSNGAQNAVVEGAVVEVEEEFSVAGDDVVGGRLPGKAAEG